MAFWYPAVGWPVFFVTFVLAIILYAKYRKLYVIFYLISISLYIFTAAFAVDVFEFGKLGILSTLVISAIIFMGLGYYLSRVFHDEGLSKKPRR